jgi:hypothetical protein
MEGKPQVLLWRPFMTSECESLVRAAAALVPVLPFPARFVPVAVGLADGMDALLPPSHACSPVLLGGLARAVYDLIADLTSRETAGWEEFECSLWTRSGPYLIPRPCSPDEYRRIFSEFLEAGILLNPDHSGVNIIPGEYTSGEIGYIKKREMLHGT